MVKKRKTVKYVIGIDEVGRGALAGPVTVAALLVPRNFRFKNKNSKLPLRDSKKLSPKQREDWLKFIKKSALCYSIASVSPKMIDRINVSKAANLAAGRAFEKLIINYRLPITKIKVFLDGGLCIKLNSKFKNLFLRNIFHREKNAKLQIKIKNFKFKTIIKGDEKIKAIMLASIAAKVSRDKALKKLHKKCSRYNFDKHKGYGTKNHIFLIRRYGLSKFHRKSFIKRSSLSR